MNAIQPNDGKTQQNKYGTQPITTLKNQHQEMQHKATKQNNLLRMK